MIERNDKAQGDNSFREFSMVQGQIPAVALAVLSIGIAASAAPYQAQHFCLSVCHVPFAGLEAEMSYQQAVAAFGSW